MYLDDFLKINKNKKYNFIVIDNFYFYVYASDNKKNILQEINKQFKTDFKSLDDALNDGVINNDFIGEYESNWLLNNNKMIIFATNFNKSYSSYNECNNFEYFNLD